jgi:hypothetical protein
MTNDQVFAVDPGPVESGFALVQRADNPEMPPLVLETGKVPNPTLLLMVSRMAFDSGAILVLEQLEGMGMPASRALLDTAVWSGRFIQVWTPVPYAQVARRWVKLHLCGQSIAKDANVRAAILDRFGGEKARGVKAAPGPLYGVKLDAWSALGVALTYLESGHEFTEAGKLVITVAEVADEAVP